LVRAEGTLGNALELLTTQTLRAAEDRARHLGASKVELRVGSGDVAQSLINIIASHPVELVVVGRRGRGQLAGLLLGSVSRSSLALRHVQSPSFLSENGACVRFRKSEAELQILIYRDLQPGAHSRSTIDSVA
jgi:hypothetical protein